MISTAETEIFQGHTKLWLFMFFEITNIMALNKEFMKICIDLLSYRKNPISPLFGQNNNEAMQGWERAIYVHNTRKRKAKSHAGNIRALSLETYPLPVPTNPFLHPELCINCLLWMTSGQLDMDEFVIYYACTQFCSIAIVIKTKSHWALLSTVHYEPHESNY